MSRLDYITPAGAAAQSPAQHQHTLRRKNRAHASGKIIFVRYFATEMMVDTELLEPSEELAYRRIFDRVLQTCDRLPDDDALLARLAKITVRSWAQIKAKLLELGMIIAKAGRITIARCQQLIREARQAVAQKQRAGKASAAARATKRAFSAPNSAAAKSLQPVEPALNFNAVATNHESGLTIQIDPPDGGSLPLSPPPGDFARSAARATAVDTLVGEQEEAASAGEAMHGQQPSPPPPTLEAAFEAFTGRYPSVVNLRATRAALAEALRNTPFEEIDAGIDPHRAWLAQPGNNTQAKNSARWLREEGWRDRRYFRPPDPAAANVVHLPIRADVGNQQIEILMPLPGGRPPYESRSQRRSRELAEHQAERRAAFGLAG